ncbi:hypothetical protein VTI28DRAFT_5453 [Corynascus sepedonium]
MKLIYIPVGNYQYSCEATPEQNQEEKRQAENSRERPTSGRRGSIKDKDKDQDKDKDHDKDHDKNKEKEKNKNRPKPGDKCKKPGKYQCFGKKAIQVCDVANILRLVGNCPETSHCAYLNGIPFCVIDV